MKNKNKASSFDSDVVSILKGPYKKLGSDLNPTLDEWADEYTDVFEELDVEYPQDGTTEAKLNALTRVFIKNRLEGVKTTIETFLIRKRSGEELRSEELSYIGELEDKLDAEEARNPKFKLIINQTRAKISELRKLLKQREVS